MQAARNIAETRVNFNYSPIVCNIYKINKGIKQPIHIEPGKTEIMGWLQLVSTDLVGLVTPVARGNYHFGQMFRLLHKVQGGLLISTKDKVLTARSNSCKT